MGLDINDRAPFLTYKYTSKYDPSDSSLQLVNGFLSKVVVGDYTDFRQPIKKTKWYDPDLEQKADRKARKHLSDRIQTFGINSDPAPNIHFIARTEEERTKLREHDALNNPDSLLVISTGAKFIPALNLVPWEGIRGLESQICTLFSRMLWGLRREEEQTRIQGLMKDLTIKGLKPSPPPKIITRDLAEVTKTVGIVFQERHGLSLAFRKWAKSTHQRAKELHDELLNPKSALNREAKRKQNLHCSLRTAFYNLKKHKNEIGISIADKNLGPTVYKQDLYDELAEEYLRESGIYMRIGDCSDELKSSLLKKQLEALTNAEKHIPEGSKSKDVVWLLNRIRFVASTNKKLSGFYIIVKVHKMKDTIPLRPLQPAVGTALECASQWIHSLLCETVHAHPNVLKSSKAWIDKTKNLRLQKRPKLITMDVEALYPSIAIREGLVALRWFLKTFCSHIHADFHDYIIELARVVLTENYINAWPHGIYQQTSGTAMGTAFAVMYATIFMLWYEEPILEEFKDCIMLYGRYIDDGHTLWVGPEDREAAFIQRLQTHNPRIKWEIKASNTHSDFLDVRTSIAEFQLEDGSTAWGFTHNIYCKPLNTYAYLPFSSFHGNHVPKAWIKAEIFRFETLCTFESDFNDATNFLCARLAERGYPLGLLKRL